MPWAMSWEQTSPSPDLKGRTLPNKKDASHIALGPMCEALNFVKPT